MDDPFCSQANVDEVSEQPLNKRDDFLGGKSVVIDHFEDPRHNDNFCKVSFEEDTGMKEIIVEKLEDYMEEGQFSQLSVIDANPEDLTQYYDENTIVYVPGATSVESCNKTLVLSNKDSEEILSDLFEDSRFSEIPVSNTSSSKEAPGFISDECQESSKVKKNQSNKCDSTKKIDKKKKKNTGTNLFTSDVLIEHSYKRKKKDSVKVDKSDPRSRLHFVKYLKKDKKYIKIWECGICSKEFFHQYTLMRHLPIHTDERNYKCEECGKAFRQWSTLAQHKVTHSEYRPYVCDICQKTFTRVSTLTSHKKIHSNRKANVCHICGKAFHQQINLKNHLHTHTNAKPYKCDICGKGFNQASNLQNHKLKTHSDGAQTWQMVENRYKCSVCPENFSRRASLRQHEQYVHQIKNILTSKNSYKGDSKNSIYKKTKIGNIRIIQIPNVESPQKESKSGLLIDPIDTKAMHRALAQGITPFALLKPLNNPPVVVKVKLCNGSKHMLVPASAAELREAGKFAVTGQDNGSQSVQIKVPVVATVHQKINKLGQVRMEVEPPSDEEPESSQEPNNKSLKIKPKKLSLDSTSFLPSSVPDTYHFTMNPAVMKKPLKDPNMYPNDEEMLLTAPEGIEYVLPSGGDQPSDDLLSATVNLEPTKDHKMEPIAENLIGIESQIQYLRATENVDEYVIVEPEESTHYATADGVIQPLKSSLEENPTDQFWLMDVLQNAGIQFNDVTTDVAPQIILNSVDDSIIVDDEAVQMVINNVSDDVEDPSVDIDRVEASALGLSLEK